MQRKTQEEKSPARLPGNHSGDNWWLSRLFSGAPVRELRIITNVACIQRGVSQRKIKQSRDNRPSTSKTGVEISTAVAKYAAISGGIKGSRYSSENSESVVSQFASFVIAEFQKMVATANRSGSASHV